MAERSVEDSPFPIVAIPRQWKLFGLDALPRNIAVFGIEPDLCLRFGWIEVSKLVDLLLQPEGFRPDFGNRIAAIERTDSHFSVLGPRMAIEVGADHLPIFRPFIECIGSTMNADKSTTGFYKLEEE